MRIYVVNGRKALKFIKLISVILLLAIGICTISDILERKFVSTSSEANVGKVIIIDAGHGGEDSGAIGVTGVLEKDLNLSIALQLCEALKQKGYTVILTRTEDKMLYLPEENIKGMRKISDLKRLIVSLLLSLFKLSYAFCFFFTKLSVPETYTSILASKTASVMFLYRTISLTKSTA